MNSLSWLIYFGSVSGSASSFFAFLAFVGAAVAILGAVLTFLFTDRRDEALTAQFQKLNARGAALVSRGVTMLVVCGLLATALPDRNAVYAIAASELGERIARSEAVTDISNEALATLKDWLKQQRDQKPK